jgi:hypothetical protein
MSVQGYQDNTYPRYLTPKFSCERSYSSCDQPYFLEASARLLQRSLASVGIEPLIVIVRSVNQFLDAVRESNPVEAPAPV